MFSFERRNYTRFDDDENSADSVPTKQILVGLSIFASMVLVGFVAIPGNSSSSGSSSGQVILQQKTNENAAVVNITAAKTTQVLRTNHGKLEGIVLKSRSGRNYTAFYNIPYGQPPVGILRFEAPLEFKQRWVGTRDATKPGAKCMQTSISGEGQVSGSEDCLYLSVYTPRDLGQMSRRTGTGNRNKKRPKDLLPVMVYLLGGAFVKGQASIYGGDYFLDKDVIIVLPETRLGVLAFFTTGDSVIPGNMGFKDQIMALKWVQANIAKFGGDPKKVTIFGNSSGAMSVHAHMVSNSSAGLFHRAISQSGVAILKPSQILNDPMKTALEIGNHVKCPVLNNTRKLVDCLKSTNATELLLFANKNVIPVTIETVPEGAGENSGAFLSDVPLKIMQEKRAHSKNIPWMLGVNSDEYNILGAMLASPNITANLNSDWDKMVLDMLEIPVDNNGNTTMKKIKDFYFGDKAISNVTRQNFTNMKNDRDMNHPTYLAATLQANLGMNNVYLYMLSKKPVKSLGSFLEDIYEPPYGVTHADEVQYFFPYLKFPYIGQDSVDLKMSTELVDIWTRFAATGKPHETWKPVKAGAKGKDLKWFQLDDNSTMINFAGERMEFWHKFDLNYLYA